MFVEPQITSQHHSTSRGAALVLGLAVLLAGGYAAALLASGRPSAAIFGLLTHALLCAPGVLIVRRLAGAEAGWLPALTFGPFLGLVLSHVPLLALWAAGGRGLWLIPVAGLAVAAMTPLARPARWRFTATLPGDRVCLALLLLIVPVLVTLPFWHVGAQIPEGQAYRAYFTADYIWRRAVVLELVKGAFLPVNPFYAGDALHYYWLPHLQSAIEFRALGGDLNDPLLVRSVLVDAAFVSLLYGFARLFVRTPWAAALAVTCCILFSSFEGAYGIWDHWRVGAPLAMLRNFNIDAISRWLFQSLPVDGLQRLLWYQPHHALGYGAGLLGLLAVSLRSQRYDPAAMVCAGVLLGLSMLISSFGALMFTAAAALHEGVSVLRWRDWMRGAVHAAVTFVPLAAGAALVFILKYVDSGSQIIVFGVNPTAFHNLLPAALLSFGPILILGLAGALIAFGARRGDMSPVVAVLAVCVVFYFFVDVRDHQHVYVGWRAGHLTFMVSAALIGLAFERLAHMPRAMRTTGGIAIALVMLASAPTVAIDAYNTQDISNRDVGAGFRWTLLLTRDEQDAFAWIERHTGPDELIQLDPGPRDPDTWAYLAAFPGRRMFGGLPISMVPLKKYEERSARIREIFDIDPIDAHNRARRSGVRYIFIGPPERAAHPGLEERFASQPALLPLVYRNPLISIYGVANAP